MTDEHRIRIVPTQGRVTVRLDGELIAESDRAVTLGETGHAPVQYLPREDVDMARLEPSAHRTRCPWKGEARHFSLAGAGARGENAAWSYETPLPAAAAIAGRIAFYPDRADVAVAPSA